MSTETRQAPPAYFAFKTLTNLIVRMEEHGPPPRIDRTFLSGMSGAGQTQFLAGLKSLGLIDEEGATQATLVDLVNRPDDRPRLIGQMLRNYYPEAVELGKTAATTGQLVEIFNEYGVRGDTARKAIAFYLNAANYAGDIPLSPHFKTPSVTSGAPRRRGRPARTTPGAEQNGHTPDSGNGLPTGLHPALAGLLGDIPKRGQTWTQRQHDDFMAAFRAVIKIAVPISDEQIDYDEILVEDEA
jgi:hypothetical protein